MPLPVRVGPRVGPKSADPADAWETGVGGGSGGVPPLGDEEAVIPFLPVNRRSSRRLLCKPGFSGTLGFCGLPQTHSGAGHGVSGRSSGGRLGRDAVEGRHSWTAEDVTRAPPFSPPKGGPACGRGRGSRPCQNELLPPWHSGEAVTSWNVQ